MKQFCYLMIILLLTTSCSNKTNIDKKDIVNIKYQNIIINSKDYDNLIDDINNLNFSKRKINDNFKDKITITSEDGIHTFNISKNNNIKYTINNRTLYSKNTKTIKKIKNSINSLLNKYLDKSFYTFKLINNYKENDKDLIIKIDNVNQYYQLITDLPIRDLSIHRVEKKDNEYYDIDYIYNKKNIENKKIIIRMNPLKDYSSYRISFTNTYGMNVSIIPIIDTDKENGEIKYIINYNFRAKEK